MEVFFKCKVILNALSFKTKQEAVGGGIKLLSNEWILLNVDTLHPKRVVAMGTTRAAA